MTQPTESQQIKEICERAGLTVDSVDGDKGFFTVTFFTRAYTETDAKLMTRVQAIERQQTGCYTVRSAGNHDVPLERLTFQRRVS